MNQIERVTTQLESKIEDTLKLMDEMDEEANDTVWMSLACREIILKEILSMVKKRPFEPKEEMYRLILNTRSHTGRPL